MTHCRLAAWLPGSDWVGKSEGYDSLCCLAGWLPGCLVQTGWESRRGMTHCRLAAWLRLGGKVKKIRFCEFYWRLFTCFLQVKGRSDLPGLVEKWSENN
jgi:hypothetical protein